MPSNLQHLFYFLFFSFVAFAHSGFGPTTSSVAVGFFLRLVFFFFLAVAVFFFVVFVFVFERDLDFSFRAGRVTIWLSLLTRLTCRDFRTCVALCSVFGVCVWACAVALHM